MNFNRYKSFFFSYRNRKVDTNLRPLDLPVIGVYHVMCINDWQKLVKEQIEDLKASGLYDKMETLHLSVVTSNEEDLTILQKLVGNKSKVIAVNENPKVYEFPAIDFIYKKSKNSDFLVFYFHTKGISYIRSEGYDQNRNFDKLKLYATQWRTMMQYFIFTKWKDAVRSLSNYDCYGCCVNNWQPPHYYTFYQGNFWWSKASYIRTIKPINELDRQDRYRAESWLCQNTQKIFSAFDTTANLYGCDIPDSLYRDDMKIPVTKFIKLVTQHYIYQINKIMKKL